MDWTLDKNHGNFVISNLPTPPRLDEDGNVKIQGYSDTVLVVFYNDGSCDVVKSVDNKMMLALKRIAARRSEIQSGDRFLVGKAVVWEVP